MAREVITGDAARLLEPMAALLRAQGWAVQTRYDENPPVFQAGFPGDWPVGATVQAEARSDGRGGMVPWLVTQSGVLLAPCEEPRLAVAGLAEALTPWLRLQHRPTRPLSARLPRDLAPGWHLEQVGKRLLGRRLAVLSDYQMSNGCLEEVAAAGPAELVLLCQAQSRLADQIATAQSFTPPDLRRSVRPDGGTAVTGEQVQTHEDLMLQLAAALVDEELHAKIVDTPQPCALSGRRRVYVQNPQVPDWSTGVVIGQSPLPLDNGLWWFFSWNERIAPTFDLYGAVDRIKARMTPGPSCLSLSEGVGLIEGRLFSRTGLPADCRWARQFAC